VAIRGVGAGEQLGRERLDGHAVAQRDQGAAESARDVRVLGVRLEEPLEQGARVGVEPEAHERAPCREQ